MSRRRGGYVPGGWRGTEVWLDTDEVLWFGDLARTVKAVLPVQPLLAGAGAAVALPAPASGPARSGEGRAAALSRKQRLATRLFPTVAALAATGAGVPLYLSHAAAQASELPLPPLTPAARTGIPAQAPSPSPSLLFPSTISIAGAAPAESSEPAASAPAAEASSSPNEKAFPEIHWRNSRAVGLPHAGSLVDGVRFPVKGPGWVTWDPALDRVPNRMNRLYGTDVLVRTLLDVIAEYRAAHPNAPPLVVGDLSRRGGGEIDEHASHENGLDVDIYYPRLDGRAKPPATVAQVDMALAQELVDRFVAAGAQMVFVGPSTPLHGPEGVVVPWSEHDNHLHVRIPATLTGPR